MAGLRDLQEKRARERKALLNTAAPQYIAAVHEGSHETWEPNAFEAHRAGGARCARLESDGFEFSMAEVELRALDIEPDLFAEWAEENAALEAAARKIIIPKAA